MSLLGPEGPEVSCEECFERLDEYVEGRPVPGMAAHLEGCPACREDYESLLALVRDEDDGAQTEV
jgi:predicted anti-sigma-YlaC factor YlaD